VPSSAVTRLSDAQRQVAFLASAAVVLAVVAGVGVLANSGHASHGVGVRAARLDPGGAGSRIVDEAALRATTSVAGSRSISNRSKRSPVPRADDHGLILGDARAFLPAYLAYEIGMLDSRSRIVLTQTATRAFALQLLRHPINLPARDRPTISTIQSLKLSRAGASEASVDATIDDAGLPSGLNLYLRPVAGKWLVSRVK
jgi:hypothetical protein